MLLSYSERVQAVTALRSPIRATVEPINQLYVKRRGSDRGIRPADRPPSSGARLSQPQARRHNQKVPGIFADRDRGAFGSPILYCWFDRRRALSRICGASQRIPGIHRGHFGITATAVVCFQASDILRVSVSRASCADDSDDLSWAFVFLRLSGSFFANPARGIATLALGIFFVGLAALVTERLLLRAMVPAGRGSRLDRRTIVSVRIKRRKLNPRRSRQTIPNHILCVFDDRNDSRAAGDLAGSAKLGKVALSNSPAAPASISCCSAADFGETRILEMLKKLWCCR